MTFLICAHRICRYIWHCLPREIPPILFFGIHHLTPTYPQPSNNDPSNDDQSINLVVERILIATDDNPDETDLT